MKNLFEIILVGLLTFSATDIFAQESGLTLTLQQIKKLDKLFDIRESDAEPCNHMVTNPEHIVWKTEPINVVLPLGKERIITFPAGIEFGYDKNILPSDTLTIQNNNGTLYLTAKKAFAVQRVAVKLTNSGKIILLNLSAQKEADTTPIDIVLSDGDKITSNNNINNDADNNTEIKIKKNKISEVELMRFAVQQLYAPKRLLTQPNNIYRTPMHLKKTASLFLDDSVIAMPLASWRSDDLTITAFLLHNTLKQSLNLDPRVLCGNWQTATFYPRHELSPAGSTDDSSTVFLISNQSASNALIGCGAG